MSPRKDRDYEPKWWVAGVEKNFRAQHRTKQIVLWMRGLPPETWNDLDDLIDAAYRDGIYSRATSRRDIYRTMLKYRQLAMEVHYAPTLPKESSDDRDQEDVPGLRQDVHGGEVLSPL